MCLALGEREPDFSNLITREALGFVFGLQSGRLGQWFGLGFVGKS